MAGSERAAPGAPEAPTAAPGTAAPISNAVTSASDRSGTETGLRERRDAAGHSAAGGPAEIDERQKFQITCLRNSHYHEDRERFFARLHKLTMFVVVLGGATTFAPLERYWITALIITVAGLVDLVFDVSGKSRLHASLRRRIYEILAESQDDDVDLIKSKKRAIDVYADEPPCMHAVNALAYNSAMEAFKRPAKLQMKITGWQRFWRNVYPYPQTTFKTFEELERPAAAG
jgi:hypothetical protein